MITAQDIEQAVAAKSATGYFGEATARKGGRNPRWPYVPVVAYTNPETGLRTTKQIKGLAYATRAEAVDSAARTIAAEQARVTAQLGQRAYRALRESYGLPRELENQDI